MRRSISQLVFCIYEVLMWPSGLAKQRLIRSVRVVSNTRIALALGNLLVLIAMLVWILPSDRLVQSSWQWLRFSEFSGYAAFGSWLIVNVLTMVTAIMRVFPSRSEEACWLVLAMVGTLMAAALINAPFAPGANWD